MGSRKFKKLAGNILIKNKKEYKKRCKACKLCGEDDPNLLDVHRIIPGKDEGRYTENNSITCCCKCHRLIHADKITIFGWVKSTAGKLLHIKKNGVEDFV